MNLILPLINILSTSLLLSVLFNKKLDITIPIAFTINVLTIFLFGLFTNLSVGFYFTWLYLLTTLILLRNNKNKNIKNLVITPGTIVFILFYIAIFFITKNHQFRCVDEFYHLGEMVRENIRLDNFYSINESNLIYHKEYPPFFSLIETMFCQFDGFNFTERSCYRGLMTYEMSLFIPLFNNLYFKKENTVKIISSIIIIISSLFFMHLNDYDLENAVLMNSIYVDWCMVIMFVYVFIKGYITDKWEIFDFVSASIMMSALMLTKQIALALYALAFTYIVLIQIIKKHVNLKNIFLTIIFMILIPAMFYLLWNRYTSQFSINAQFSILSIRPQDLLPIYRFEKGYAWQYESIYNFVWSVKFLPILYKPFKMPYLLSSVCITLIIILILIFSKRNTLITIITPSVYFLGSVGYAFAMLNLYVFTFGEIEGVQLSCFDRYMGSYIYAGLLICVFLTINNFASNSKNIKILISVLMFLSFVNYKDLKYLIPRTNEKTIRDVYEEHYQNSLGKMLIIDENNLIADYLDFTMVDYFYMHYKNRPHDKIIKTSSFELDDLNNYDFYVFVSLKDESKTFNELGRHIEFNTIYKR